MDVQYRKECVCQFVFWDWHETRYVLVYTAPGCRRGVVSRGAQLTE